MENKEMTIGLLSEAILEAVRSSNEPSRPFRPHNAYLTRFQVQVDQHIQKCFEAEPSYEKALHLYAEEKAGSIDSHCQGLGCQQPPCPLLGNPLQVQVVSEQLTDWRDLVIQAFETSRKAYLAKHASVLASHKENKEATFQNLSYTPSETSLDGNGEEINRKGL